MKKRTVIFTLLIVFVIFPLLFIIILAISCRQDTRSSDMNIIFLHHSTGEHIWDGKPPAFFKKALKKISPEFADCISNKRALLPSLLKEYNKNNDKDYHIEEMDFPKASPYGWNNFPFDYYNIWVKHAGEEPFMEEPTLEMLTKDYELIIFKHCFPVCYIQADQGSADINSDVKTLSNYKLQYSALRDKLNEFPETKFILFTGAAQVKSNISEEAALRSKEFFEWVTDEWDLPGDNIYIWDLYSLQTEGGLYFKDEYAVSPTNSHPNHEFAGRVVNDLFNRIIDVVENNGKGTLLNGKVINN